MQPRDKGIEESVRHYNLSRITVIDTLAPKGPFSSHCPHRLPRFSGNLWQKMQEGRKLGVGGRKHRETKEQSFSVNPAFFKEGKEFTSALLYHRDSKVTPCRIFLDCESLHIPICLHPIPEHSTSHCTELDHSCAEYPQRPSRTRR